MLAQFAQSLPKALGTGIFLALFVSHLGCHHTKKVHFPDSAISTYQPGEAVSTQRAPGNGVYTLYCCDVGIKSIFMREDTHIGFDRTGEGYPRAVASDERLPISEWPHHWRLTTLEKSSSKEEQTAAKFMRETDQALDVFGSSIYIPLAVIAWWLEQCG